MRKITRYWYLSVLALISQPVYGQYFPKPLPAGSSELTQAPYSSTGLIQSTFGRTRYSGSGAVASDPRLIYSCAHLFADIGVWASQVTFARRFSSRTKPSKKNLVTARGYRILSGYAPNYFDYQFELDFAIVYGGLNTNFGPPLSKHPKLHEGLESDLNKLVLGYPSYRDIDYASGFYYLHRTGPFNTPFVNQWDTYYEVEGVSTGPGNSGGPALVANGNSYALSGILVSGAYNLAGAFGLNSESEASEIAVLGDLRQGVPIRVSKPSMNLRDGSKSYNKIPYIISGRAAVGKVLLDLNITTSNSNQIDAYLRSPAGRTKVIAKRSPGIGAPNINLAKENISAPFLYTKATGKWTLFVRDSVKGSPSKVESSALEVSTLWLQ